MISTGSIGNGTTNPNKDIVTKDLKARRLKGKVTNARHVLNEVKTALKHKEPMMIAIAKPKKK